MSILRSKVLLWVSDSFLSCASRKGSCLQFFSSSCRFTPYPRAGGVGYECWYGAWKEFELLKECGDLELWSVVTGP